MSKIIIWANAESGGEQIILETSMLTRHWLITWATWTGKTVSLQVLAETLSLEWIPVFTADVKWDLAWLAFKWETNKHITKRVDYIWLETHPQPFPLKIPSHSLGQAQEGSSFEFKNFPTIFWDIYWKKWHSVRTTISEMWPMLLSKLLDLSNVQDAILHIIFKFADDSWYLLLDIKDLKSLLKHFLENEKEIEKEYWNITPASITSILRQLLILEDKWWDIFFGEPALDINDLFKKDFNWNWVISILDSSELMKDIWIYSVFLLFLLSELFEKLPEVWDLEKPKLVFFFDEAHLIFRDAPRVLINKIESVIRLIRSKWIWIFFVTQNPLDIPENIRWQLWNRIAHAMRVFTPKEEKAARIVANTFRQNTNINPEILLRELKVWYSLVSTLDSDWRPTKVKHIMMRPPMSRMWSITENERLEIISRSPIWTKYDNLLDRESAYEILKELKSKSLHSQSLEWDANQEWDFYKDKEIDNTSSESNLFWTLLKTITQKNWRRQSYLESFTKNILRKVWTKVANSIVRWIFGSMK